MIYNGLYKYISISIKTDLFLKCSVYNWKTAKCRKNLETADQYGQGRLSHRFVGFSYVHRI